MCQAYDADKHASEADMQRRTSDMSSALTSGSLPSFSPSAGLPFGRLALGASACLTGSGAGLSAQTSPLRSLCLGLRSSPVCQRAVRVEGALPDGLGRLGLLDGLWVWALCPNLPLAQLVPGLALLACVPDSNQGQGTVAKWLQTTQLSLAICSSLA